MIISVGDKSQPEGGGVTPPGKTLTPGHPKGGSAPPPGQVGHGAHEVQGPLHHTQRGLYDSLSHLFPYLSLTTRTGILSPILLVGKNEA